MCSFPLSLSHAAHGATSSRHGQGRVAQAHWPIRASWACRWLSKARRRRSTRSRRCIFSQRASSARLGRQDRHHKLIRVGKSYGRAGSRAPV
eukprot:917633-Pyramimonas_sp.AAC.1